MSYEKMIVDSLVQLSDPTPVTASASNLSVEDLDRLEEIAVVSSTSEIEDVREKAQKLLAAIDEARNVA